MDQANLNIGVKEILYSQILIEQREIFIHLPKTYSFSTPSYPVVFLLNAEMNFDYYSRLVDMLSKPPYTLLPELIVIGIKNTDRTRDLTTSSSTKKSYILIID